MQGNDLTLNTLREPYNQSIIWNANNFCKEVSHIDIGSTVQAVGNLRLSARQDINLKAADVSAETGGLWATAGRDINLTTGEDYSFVDDAHQSKSKGFLSSKTTNTRDTVIQTTALGSTLSGETIGVTNPVLSAVQTIGQLKDAAGNTSDTRMKALAGATAGLSAYNAYDAVATGQGQTINGKDNQAVTKVDDKGNPVETRAPPQLSGWAGSTSASVSTRAAARATPPRPATAPQARPWQPAAMSGSAPSAPGRTAT